MDSNKIVDDLVDVGARVVDQRIGVHLVTTHVHAGLDGAHQWVTLVLQVRLCDGGLETRKRVFGSLHGLDGLWESETVESESTFYEHNKIRNVNSSHTI